MAALFVFQMSLFNCFPTSLSSYPCFFVLAGPSQDVFLLPHIPCIGQGGSILLVHYSMIVLKPAIFWINDPCLFVTIFVSLFSTYCFRTFFQTPKNSHKLPTYLPTCVILVVVFVVRNRSFSTALFKNGPTLLFLLIFVVFKNKFYRKNCSRQRDSNSDRRVEVENPDHLTTTTFFFSSLTSFFSL